MIRPPMVKIEVRVWMIFALRTALLDWESMDTKRKVNACSEIIGVWRNVEKCNKSSKGEQIRCTLDGLVCPFPESS
jgi:hypothetical protein